MEENEYAILKESRKYARAKITRKLTEINSGLDGLSLVPCREQLLLLKSLHSKLKEYNDKIAGGVHDYISDATILHRELETIDKYDEDVCLMVHRLELRISLLTDSASSTNGNNSNQSPNVSGVTQGQLRLPHISLPEYSHSEDENLSMFFHNFESILVKFNLSEFEKFVLLEGQLKGEPAVLIKSLQGSKRSYSEAKSLLMEAFASTITESYNIISRLANIKLNEGENPYKFISDLKIIKDSFRTLKIDVDTVLAYFFWQAMPESFKREMIHITNTSKPTLPDIDKSLFNAAERYLNLHAGGTSKDVSEKYTGLAVKVTTGESMTNNSKFRSCVLCNNSNHVISKCTKFVTPRDKANRLKELKACLRCANISHRASECKFRFHKPCFHCNGQHFSFLCLSNKPDRKIKGEVNTTSSTITVNCEALSLGATSHVLLPTFTCKLKNGYKLRGLKDTGCQTTFLRTDIARKYNLKFISKIKLSINGFNSTQSYNTEVVEVELMFGSDCHKINAILIDDIASSMSLPGLKKIVAGFTEKGYNLSDSFLLDGDDSIGNFDILLGMSYNYCLPEKTILFGSDPPSTFSETPSGIMIMGSIPNLERNIKCLPDCSKQKITTNFISDISARKRSRKRLKRQHRKRDSNRSTQDNVMYLSVNNCAIKSFEILDSAGNLKEEELTSALHDAISVENDCYKLVNCVNLEDNIDSDKVKILDKQCLDFVIDNIKLENSRIVVPITWNSDVCHLLKDNYFLAKKVLMSSLAKVEKNVEHLHLIDKVINDQVDAGIIEKISNINEFRRDFPNSSFLAHIPIFRMNKESTKCRLVFLSNLSQRNSVSHNTAILSGPNLNHKMSTVLLHMRFNKYIVCFDLVKAFHQLQLLPIDQVKFCFLWFNSVAKNDFSIVAYKHIRLPMGIRCSPTLLMAALYYILIYDTSCDTDCIRSLKKSMYSLSYMDNVAFSSGSSKEALASYELVEGIFDKFNFSCQQFMTNCREVNDRLPDVSAHNKLFGLCWNTDRDVLSTDKLTLNATADTKRSILQSIASNFDVYNYNAPLLNRAKLFLHDLQCEASLKWDDKLSLDKIEMWQKICKQINSSPNLTIDRCVGDLNDQYWLCAFTDSSKNIYGCVIYIINLVTHKVSFLLSKNRIVPKQWKTKSIPSLELQGATFGVETLLDTFEELSGETCVNPVNISKLLVCTDSAVILNWISSYNVRLDKCNKYSVFVANRLEKIGNLCNKHPINFKFCAGKDNPADFVTKPFSYNVLCKSNYISGLSLNEIERLDKCGFPDIVVPSFDITANVAKIDEPIISLSPIYDCERSSKFSKVVNVHRLVLGFVDRLKRSLVNKSSNVTENMDDIGKAYRLVILREQLSQFPDIVSYFEGSCTKMPNLVSQLNLFMDDFGIVRVKAKFKTWKCSGNEFPILLCKSSHLTNLIIREIHEKSYHRGIYHVLADFRKLYYVSHHYSIVKKCLQQCVQCKRVNSRSVNINQSDYRDFRLEPINIPFKYSFVDYLGPLSVDYNNERCKVYLLLITCLWSRSVQIYICKDMTVSSFLRAFQLHIFKFGLPENIFSDMGSNLVAAGNVITDFLKDVKTQDYFAENNIKTLNFQQYPKGCSKLGSLVEACVKLVKRLIFGAVRNLILKFDDFELLIAEINNLVNRRPIAFKEALRDPAVLSEVPFPITPEILLHGRELEPLCLIPQLHVNGDDPNWDVDVIELVRNSYTKLSKAREYLSKSYGEEFLGSLISQAVNKKDRYKAVNYKEIKVGDIVVVKENFCKVNNFPLGLVLSVDKNDLDEVTSVGIRKSGSNAVIKRHISCIIPLLTPDLNDQEQVAADVPSVTDNPISRPQRESARRARVAISELIDDGAV